MYDSVKGVVARMEAKRRKRHTQVKRERIRQRDRQWGVSGYMQCFSFHHI